MQVEVKKGHSTCLALYVEINYDCPFCVVKFSNSNGWKLECVFNLTAHNECDVIAILFSSDNYKA